MLLGRSLVILHSSILCYVSVVSNLINACNTLACLLQNGVRATRVSAESHRICRNAVEASVDYTQVAGQTRLHLQRSGTNEQQPEGQQKI